MLLCDYFEVGDDIGDDVPNCDARDDSKCNEYRLLAKYYAS